MKFVYDHVLQMALEGRSGWKPPLTTLRTALLADGYTASSAHVSLADVPTGAVLQAFPMFGLTATAGVADARTINFYGISATVVAVLVYVSGATPDTSALIYYSDEGTGLPLVGDKGTINADWPDGLFLL